MFQKYTDLDKMDSGPLFPKLNETLHKNYTRFYIFSWNMFIPQQLVDKLKLLQVAAVTGFLTS